MDKRNLLALALGISLFGLAFAGTKLDHSAANSQASQAVSQTGTASLININTADADQLTGLPHIGPKLAQRIIDYRTQHGNFKALDDLANVRGISESRVKQMNGLATVG